MLVLPGPGMVVIIAGLAILATEYVWAERMLAAAKAARSRPRTRCSRRRSDHSTEQVDQRDIVSTDDPA